MSFELLRLTFLQEFHDALLAVVRQSGNDVDVSARLECFGKCESIHLIQQSFREANRR